MLPATSTVIASTFSGISSFVTFGSNLVVLIAGAFALIFSVYKLCTGGFGFMKATHKVSKFVDRVDVLIDDFWPEILSGLESKSLISTGSTARWTSTQARILKTQSPIQITPVGNKIIADIGFSGAYSTSSEKILSQVRSKLADKSNITDLDIEQASLQVGAELFDQDDSLIEEAKKYLFEHPTMPVSQLKVLIGIFIRDKIITDENTKKAILPR